jgi:hypothetical protein
MSNSNWKGGRTIHRRGYVMLRIPEHPRAIIERYQNEAMITSPTTTDV